uniref:Uncharacterized protein n=1 Tax=Zea mays TaxID=4577 RepID=C4J7K8_MAIZE|nr:unknown [Zea mays]
MTTLHGQEVWRLCQIEVPTSYATLDILEHLTLDAKLQQELHSLTQTGSKQDNRSSRPETYYFLYGHTFNDQHKS